MKTISILDDKGEAKGKFSLDQDFFDVSVNKSLLRQVVLMYLANQRAGCASTKTRRQVRGGGRKPWRQKGTGRARAGSIRSPLWRGGGAIFGPQPRRFTYHLPQNMRVLALRQSLCSKIADDRLIVVDELQLEQSKTKELARLLKTWKLKQADRPLVVLEKPGNDFLRAARNIPGLTTKVFSDINAYDVLRHNKIVFSKSALDNLIKMRKR